MIRRLSVHNFRCLENFELSLADFSSVLLLGRNGSGKTTVGQALKVLRAIARGTSRVGELVRPRDLAHGRTTAPMRFEIEAVLGQLVFSYSVAFEFPTHFRELRVAAETLTVDGNPLFSRELAEVRLWRTSTVAEAKFRIDWHQVALAIIQESEKTDPLAIFKRWLGGSLILRPIPALAQGSTEQSISMAEVPDGSVSNPGQWFTSLLTGLSFSNGMKDYLKDVMPDFQDMRVVSDDQAGRGRVLNFVFGKADSSVSLALDDLSDGEKCFVIFALTIASSQANAPLLCFWDEPDNYLAPDEVGQSIVALRKAFQTGGQLVVTSHNPEAIDRFSDENSFYLYRQSHAEPTKLRTIAEVRASGGFAGSLADAVTRGDLWP